MGRDGIEVRRERYRRRSVDMSAKVDRNDAVSFFEGPRGHKESFCGCEIQNVQSQISVSCGMRASLNGRTLVIDEVKLA